MNGGRQAFGDLPVGSFFAVICGAGKVPPANRTQLGNAKIDANDPGTDVACCENYHSLPLSVEG
jgi:hypothetical protein